MKKFLFLLLTLASGNVTTIYAQDSKGTQTEVSTPVNYTKPAQFPGGNKAMMQYMMDNIKYPEDALKQRIAGRILVSFCVEKDGSISDIAIVKSLHPSIEAEAVRVVKAMPKWEPALVGDKPERMKVTLPVKFSLPPAAAQTDDKVYEMAEVNPLFPGGNQALMDYLYRNIKYPADAMKRGVQGRVMVQFVVNSDGSISESKILKSVDPALDAEALRVVNGMPKWSPGKEAGKYVRVRYSLPITFKISENKGNNK